MLCAALFSYLFLPTLTQAQNVNVESILDHAGGLTITLDDPEDWTRIKNIQGVTLDHGATKKNIKLFVTREAYKNITDLPIDFQVDIPPKSNITMKDFLQILDLRSSGDCMPPMDFYPTYQAYEELMYSYANDYPELCTILDLGTLSSGRKILAVRLGDNQNVDEKEPVVFYTSTMHGDETAGYPIMLQLIDLLLCSYDSDPRIKNILDNITIYINPLANPDGTYRDSDESVEGAIRLNSRFVDLNRNFPDPDDGPNPDNRAYQEETLIFMAFADSVEIDLACNMHGGVEVANYPWDTYEHMPADVSWWIHICRNYASLVQENSEEGYFDSFDNGITNGYDWYEVQGGRQDFMNYFHRTREFTLELTNQKLLDSSRIPEIWEAHKEALLQFIEQSMFGLHGTITDCSTGFPVKAEVYIPDHDMDNSSIFSTESTGAYYRYLDDGFYDFEIIAEDYDTVYFSSYVDKYELTIMDIEICPSGYTSTLDNELDKVEVRYYNQSLVFDKLIDSDAKFTVFNSAGQTIIPLTEALASNPLPDHIASGVVFVRLESQNKMKTFTVVLTN